MKRIMQHKSLKVFLAMLFTATMALGGAVALAPASHSPSAVSAADAVQYMAWDETSKTVKSVDGGCTEYTVVSTSTTVWTEGWYVVNEDKVEIDTRISVSGTVNLILCDGTELKANDGIGLSNEEANINIYAQSTGGNAGKLIATGGEDSAGIGSGSGGTIGDITINGGVVNATGGSYGPGIGGASGSTCGKITINGGTVIATGGQYGAGIGSGVEIESSVEGIVIKGGVIEAFGGENAAGIGTGFQSKCGPVEITGGTITANGDGEGPGIGCCGWSSNIKSITIADTVGLLTANKGSYADFSIGIGYSYGEEDGCGPITIGGKTVGNIYTSPFVFPVYHQVTFQTNGGKIVEGSLTQYVEGIGAVLPTAVTKDQLFFDGWYDNEELTGDPVTEIDADATGDLVFYAKWTKANTIIYHLNGGEWPNGKSAPTLFKGGEAFDLYASWIMPVKLGKIFDGWYTSETLEKEIYEIPEDVTNDIELWAKWRVIATTDVVVPTAGKTEHKGKVVTVAANVNEDGKFVLDGTNTITITFEKDFFPDSPIFIEVADGCDYDSDSVEEPIIASWGYAHSGSYGDHTGDHTGFFIDPSSGHDEFNGTITISISDSTKSLVFTNIQATGHYIRTVSYNPAGGMMPEGYATKYLEGDGLKLAVPTLKGYKFGGWYESADFAGDPVTKITSEDEGDKEYFAKWEFIKVVDLSKLTEDVTIYDGQTITGKLKDNVKVTIADGATVTLKDVTIEGENDLIYAFAGITLEGDATLILEGNNTVKGFYERFPGIYVPENKTLTIGGNGTLDVSSNGHAAGIGAGRNVPCGNIVIEGGTINAIGGVISAGIGASGCSCGTITIKGGVVSATGGDGGAGIGGGEGSDCGDITITNKAKKVTAVSGSGAPNSIGSGKDGNPVRVTIAGKVYEEGISDKDFVYNSATAEEFAALIEDLGTVEYSEEYKEKLEQAREMYNYLSDEEKGKVDAATLKVLTDAEVEYKNLEDGAKAGETTDVIADLPNDITIHDKAAVEAAREAYDALTDEQKAKVDPETLAKLEAAEKEINDIETSNQVTEAINNLPSIDEITSASKDAIEAARKAYEDLSDEAKKKISKETIDNLKAAELTLGIAIFDEEFEKVPASADQITQSDKEAIEASRAAYEALTDEQKAKFPQDKLDKLVEAETALAYVTFNEEFAKIPANSDEITTADKEAIEAARAAYEALSDEEKSKFPQDKLDKLKEAESALAVITVNEAIDALPSSDEITTADKEAIEAARAAYDALTDEEKAKVGPEKLAEIEAAESALAVSTAKESIDALPSSDEITTADKEAIEAARAAYESLTNEQKAKVAPETLTKLEEAESALVVSTVSEAIDALPSSDEITTADKEAIEVARAAYESLTDEQKAKVAPETLAKIEAAESALEVSAASEVIDALPSSDEITTADKETIEAAREAYEALSDEQKAEVAPETLTKLEEAESALEVAEVVELIKNIGSVENNEESKERIEAARAAYEKLSADQKAKIKAEDLQTLVRAENAYDDLVNPKSQAPVVLLVVVCVLLVPAVLMLAYLILYITKKKGSTVMSVVGLPVLLGSVWTTGASVALYVLAGVLVAVVVADLVIAVKNPQAIKDIKNFKQLFKKDAKNDSAAAETAPAAPTQPVEAMKPAAEETQEEVKAAPVAEEPAPVAEAEAEEEGEEAVTVADGSGNVFRIRFLKSFAAKLIQSSDEAKGYYQEIKNEILSYENVSSRVSWHYESFNSGRTALIKLGVRGKTLCVYYALDAGDYENTKYKVELCASSKFAAVPCMYRIKSARRCEFAKELIAALAEKFGLVRGDERKEEYPMPYEGNEPLLERGLIKELKTKVEEPAP